MCLVLAFEHFCFAIASAAVLSVKSEIVRIAAHLLDCGLKCSSQQNLRIQKTFYVVIFSAMYSASAEDSAMIDRRLLFPRTGELLILMRAPLVNLRLSLQPVQSESENALISRTFLWLNLIPVFAVAERQRRTLHTALTCRSVGSCTLLAIALTVTQLSGLVHVARYNSSPIWVRYLECSALLEMRSWFCLGVIPAPRDISV